MPNSVSKTMYKDYQIRVVHDDSSANPFEDWDCLAPCIISSGARYSHLLEYGIDDEMPFLSDDQIRKNWKDILDTCAEFPANRAGLRQIAERFYGLTLVEAIREFLSDYYSELLASEKINFLADVYGKYMGMVIRNSSIRGCCQGDYAEILVVATPEWLKSSGVDITDSEQLADQVQLAEDWMFGNVYGYVVTKPCKECGNCDTEVLDSCFGYFGDPEESGLMDDAKATIDHLERSEVSSCGSGSSLCLLKMTN